jgi:peroxiredoxin
MPAADQRGKLVGRGVLVLFAALFLVNASWVARHCEDLRPIGKGDLAPSLSLPLVEGKGERGLADLKGKVVLVDFWATWCKPCEMTVPMQKRLYAKYAAQGFDVWSVNEDQGKDADARAAAYARTQGLPFPVVHDHDGIAAELFRVESFPHMLVVDRRGMVRKVAIGVISLSKLEEDLDQAIRASLSP